MERECSGRKVRAAVRVGCQRRPATGVLEEWSSRGGNFAAQNPAYRRADAHAMDPRRETARGSAISAVDHRRKPGGGATSMAGGSGGKIDMGSALAGDRGPSSARRTTLGRSTADALGGVAARGAAGDCCC